MRTLFIPAAAVVLALATARPADAQVIVSNGYSMPRTPWVYPASAYPGGFYNRVVTSGYTTYTNPFTSGVYNTPTYGVIISRPYVYGLNTRYTTGFRPIGGYSSFDRRWRR